MYYGTGDPSNWQKTAIASAPAPRETPPLNRYLIEYRNICIDTPCVCPVLTTTLSAIDGEHARERFEESVDSDGWEIISVERVPKRGGVRS